MSKQLLSEFKFYSGYSKYFDDIQRKETWNEAVDRVMNMHKEKYKSKMSKELEELISFAEEVYRDKLILASQRSLQFGGESIFKHEMKMYNCLVSYTDRTEFFKECMYLLLCGCGVGFSVQNKHIQHLPTIKNRNKGVKTFIIEDSIEGWADAIGVLLSSYTYSDATFEEYWGYRIDFDYSKIRPKGSFISGGFKAPGPDGLRKSIIKIQELLDSNYGLSNVKEYKIRPIIAYDVVMHMADAVLSGGVRRSATICLFSENDEEMLTAKTGDWFNTNPQRARSNNSVLLIRGEVSKERFHEIMQSVKDWGEPGFVWSYDEDIIYNPCVEIGMYPKTENGESGWQGCNLTEINGGACTTEDLFYSACKASAIIGTLQAGYTNFKYVNNITKQIFEREALLGCSITGLMNNPDILLNPNIQRTGAEIIKAVNKEVAALIGINQAARTTCINFCANKRL